MKQHKAGWRQLSEYLSYLLLAAFLFACVLCLIMDRAAGSPDTAPDWTSPKATALKRVGDVDSAQHEPNFLSNLDCSLMEYRLPDGKTMETGCFTGTAFGLMDVDSGIVIFNGSDEGLPILPYAAHQSSVAWPQADGMIALEPISTGGSYVGLYKNPTASLKDGRDSSLQLIDKQLTAPPDLLLKDPSGELLAINPQTMSFSDNGSWLVAETLNGSFVRINLATLDVMAFAPSFGATGSPELLKSQVAVSSDGRYVAINNDDAAVLRIYDLTTCDGIVVSLRPQKCDMHDYMPLVRQQISNFHALRHLRFINDGLLSFDVRTNDSNGGVYELAPRDSIGSLIDYLALGDSYTSGEGAFDYLSGTDTSDDMCHLSANSYPLLLTRALFGSNGGHSAACSGAVINDIGSNSPDYRGQVRGGATFTQLQQTQPALLNSIMASYLPGYVAQQRFVRQYQPAVITVSVGGNDIGFGDIVKNCVEPHVSLHANANTCYSTYEDRLEVTQLIERTAPRWTTLYRQLADEDPGSKIYAVGYPQIVVDNGDCGLNVHLSKSELEFSEQLIDYLNNAIRQSSVQAGVSYVDISQSLAGHRLCEAAGHDVAVNGLTAGTDGSVLGIRVFGKESYHPNALGQALIEQTILEQTNNLRAASDSTFGNDGQSILDSPETGRTVNTIVPDDSLTAGLIRAGESTAVRADGLRDGLKANTVYTVRLDGVSGPVLATVLSNDAGDVSTGVILTSGTATGGHTVDITGQNQASEPVDVKQPVYVAANNDDSDGDGINDASDSCPGAVNSSQDSDQDGIDDSCDGSINPPLTVGQSGSGGSDSNGPAGELPTIVTSFGPSDYRTSQLSTVSPISQSHGNILSLARVLGRVAISPVAASSTRLESKTLVPIRSSHEKVRAGRTFAKLRVIDWLPWTIAVIILWLLILMGLCLNRLARREVYDVYT